jgi:HTH-type transcriptional regulator/antitoxin HigA
MNIASTSDYNAALAEFEQLAVASQKDNMLRLIELRNAIDAYENAQGHEPAFPTSYAGRLELEMFKHRLKQKQLAALLGIPESRLSEILRGKRTPSLELVKKMHTELHIPANELLALA